MREEKYDFLVIGAGIFGVCTSIELIKSGYSVCILNPDSIPHPLAASTDISKIIRMEYGTDIEYMEMAVESMKAWRDWNDLLKKEIYREIGFLMTSTHTLESVPESYATSSYNNLQLKGFQPELISSTELSQRFPAFAPNRYSESIFHAIGGYAESGKAVELLLKYAEELGVVVREGQTACDFILACDSVKAIKTREGELFEAGHFIVCAGNFTPLLIPELSPYMKVTGHPVFHIRPSNPKLFEWPLFSVFVADISNTGWYGFPLHPEKGIVKIARHSQGLELHPELDERVVTREDEAELKLFLRDTFPSLLNDPIVYTRQCCYTDTLDGHFWIDNHPELRGLTIGSGGSGHGFKMGPAVGKMIAQVAEGGNHKWSDRYRWRKLDDRTTQREEARFVKDRNLD